jgi:transposase-like protein
MIAKNPNATTYSPPQDDTMPQLQIPLFPEGTTLINQNIGFLRQGSTITYVHGNLPVFTHDIDDLASFRMFTSQLYINGSASQAEICRAFGVSKISVLRSVKLYREKGMAGFFAPRVCRGPAVLTSEVLEQVQHLLDGEHSVPDIAKELDLKADTLHKALRAGKLRRPLKKRGVPAAGQQ